MAHCPLSNVLNAVGAPKSCSLLGEGRRGPAGGTENEEIHSTLMPELTEMLPTAGRLALSPPPTLKALWPSALPPSLLQVAGPLSRPSLTLLVSYLSGSEEGRQKE